MRISMFWGLVSIFLFVEKIIDDSESEGYEKRELLLPLCMVCYFTKAVRYCCFSS